VEIVLLQLLIFLKAILCSIVPRASYQDSVFLKSLSDFQVAMTNPSLCVRLPLASTQALRNRPKTEEISKVERVEPLLVLKSQIARIFLFRQNRNNRGLLVHCEKRYTNFLILAGLSKMYTLFSKSLQLL